MDRLPIDEIMPNIIDTLDHTNNVVLVAPPGAGKTTRVPLALLNEPWLKGRRILILEPRRIAARAAARYMSECLGEQVGGTIGYRMRLDTRVSAKTRVEVITEGILTRMLQTDPELKDVGIIIFDEFHERSIQADVGLALCMQSQAILREDLRILVMSATLKTDSIAELLGGAPILRCEGRSFPVTTHYLQRRSEEPLETKVVRSVCEAMSEHAGDILVFLPGMREINRVTRKLRSNSTCSAVQIVPLHGNLSQQEQDIAIKPNGERRKVILSTAIAETSVTVSGVRIVIDSGYMRISRFSPRTGLSRLETVIVSRASADQRRGRAGRQAPGICYRLWTSEEDRYLPEHSVPEICQTDLTPLALDLAVWGVSDAAELCWLDQPPSEAMLQARQLLAQLGALDTHGKITSHGKSMGQSGFHPRLAHMILTAIPLGKGSAAGQLAALLSNRASAAREGTEGKDIRIWLERLQQYRQRPSESPEQDRATYRRMVTEYEYIKKLFDIREVRDEGDFDGIGILLALAYPDRVAQGKGEGHFLLCSGRGAALDPSHAFANEQYIIAVELDDQGSEGRIHLAEPLSIQDIKTHFADRINIETTVTWDHIAQAVRTRKIESLGALVLKETPLPTNDTAAALICMLEGIATAGLGILPWTKQARCWQQRLQFVHTWDAQWPDVSDEMLLATLEEWLGPYLTGCTSRNDLQKISLSAVLEGRLSWQQKQWIDEYAPTHIMVPSGQRVPIDYQDPYAPVLAVRLQEMFGLQTTPVIAAGKVPLTLHLLSPAHRPIQVTKDLASFWRSTYFEVRKELMGRYPKHHWPDDPMKAVATNRTRPRTSS